MQCNTHTHLRVEVPAVRHAARDAAARLAGGGRARAAAAAVEAEHELEGGEEEVAAD